MSDNLQNTLPDALKLQERNTSNTSNNHGYTNTAVAPANTVLSVPVPVAIVPQNTNNANIVADPATALHAEILMNALHQGAYRPGAPIHFDNSTRFDPGIQMHDILLPFYIERHVKWPGNLKLKQMVASFRPGTSPQLMVAHVMQQLVHVRVFTVPTADQTAALPYYLVPPKKATEQLYKIILELSTARAVARVYNEKHVDTEVITQVEIEPRYALPTVTAPQPRVAEKPAIINKPKSVTATAPATAPDSKARAAPKSALNNKTQNATGVATAKVKAKAKVKKPRSKAAVTHLVTSTSAINSSKPTKPLKKQKIVFNLKKSTMIFHQPKIQTPADLLELYSNPLYSFTFPDRIKKPRPTPAPMTVASTPMTVASTPIQLEIPHALFNEENENHEEENEDDDTDSRERPTPVTVSYSPPPRRVLKKAKSPKRAKKTNHTHDKTPDPEDSLTNLPKGVTKRPSGRWQAQVYFAGASRYVGVYSSCRQANSAYDTFKKFLKPYTADATNGVFSRQKILALVEEGRRHVEKDFGIDGDDGDSIKSSQES